MTSLVPIFDLDGTLVDSDDALVAPFVALGFGRDAVPFGLPLAEACRRVGVTMSEYLAHYDTAAAMPFAGVDELLARLPRYAVCSNKDAASGRAELDRLGWTPVVALFSDSFSFGPKALGPVLSALGVEPSAVLFVGDTAHDRSCAAAVGCRFALAGWNPRAVAEPGDVVLSHPDEVLALL